MFIFILSAKQLSAKFEQEVLSWPLDITLVCSERDFLQALNSKKPSAEKTILITLDIDADNQILSDKNHISTFINLHFAPPKYPGKHAKNLAKLDGVSSFGATAHFVSEQRFQGPVIDVEMVTVAKTASLEDLGETALKASMVIIKRLLKKLSRNEEILPSTDIWNELSDTTLDITRACRISALDSPLSVEARIEVVDALQSDNAYLDLNGHRFLYEGPTPETDVYKRDQKRWAEFTEDKYRELLIKTKENYKFATYLEGRTGRHVIWRHDLDHSIHQAYEIAKIEHDLGIVTSYMFTLRLPYYNILELDTQKIAREILKMGHKAGLHFDASAYENQKWSEGELEDVMIKERDLLSQSLDAPIEAMSYHDPTCGNLIDFDKDIMAGMVNCYGKTLRNEYGYCSDSNGYWRHKPIPEVIASGEHEKLHVLTHPEWWPPTAMPPRQRIERALLLHAQDIMKIYDDHLARSGRDNIR
ncbi:MAG: hypothetical protein COA91_07685 [Robiginitomaculum sp.]|nr:MAG: hypothetical protein COA91_07685 [Robiginitomaculum sp.]